MRHVACSRATPEIASVNLGDEAEELALDLRSLPMRSIDRVDEFFVAESLCWGHPDLVRSRGRTSHHIERMFGCQALFGFRSLFGVRGRRGLFRCASLHIEPLRVRRL